MSLYEDIKQIKKLKENNMREQLDAIADRMEDEIGCAEMWKTLRPGFSTDELAENLEYIAKESDI